MINLRAQVQSSHKKRKPQKQGAKEKTKHAFDVFNPPDYLPNHGNRTKTSTSSYFYTSSTSILDILPPTSTAWAIPSTLRLPNWAPQYDSASGHAPSRLCEGIISTSPHPRARCLLRSILMNIQRTDNIHKWCSTTEDNSDGPYRVTRGCVEIDTMGRPSGE